MDEKKIALHAVDYVHKVDKYARSREPADKSVMVAAQGALVRCVHEEEGRQNGRRHTE